MILHPPFQSESLTGFELELLAPLGGSRLGLAQAIASRIAGYISYGFKYTSEGMQKNGRPLCRLLPAFRVYDREHRVFVTIVDDTTIQKELVGNDQLFGDKNLVRFPQLILDDLRLALWFERNSWSSKAKLRDVLCEPIKVFDASLIPSPKGKQTHSPRPPNKPMPSNKKKDVPPTHTLLDPYGNVLAFVSDYPMDRMRVCEIVTRPLQRRERAEVIALLCEEAALYGCTIPQEAALHTHFDSAPWKDTKSLSSLLCGYQDARHELLAFLQPNPLCRIGPMNETILRIARECPSDLPFSVLSTALQMAGISKYVDLNIKWVLHSHPPFPTLEFRAFPMTLHAETIETNLRMVEETLAVLWERSRSNNTHVAD